MAKVNKQGEIMPIFIFKETWGSLLLLDNQPSFINFSKSLVQGHTQLFSCNSLIKIYVNSQNDCIYNYILFFAKRGCGLKMK